MTTIWYEVFPVTLSSQQAILIHPPRECKVSPWMIPHQPMIHPSALVLERLTAFFGGLLQLNTMIVHSTSWRYDALSDQLLLTYLAVLPQGEWIGQWVAMGRIAVTPIGAINIVCGNHLAPPAHIHQEHVLAHALDHLAWLNAYDPAIQAVLEPEWRDVLRPKLPRPAGCLNEAALLDSRLPIPSQQRATVTR